MGAKAGIQSLSELPRRCACWKRVARRKLGGLRPRLSSETQAKVKDRFWQSNLEIRNRYGFDLNSRFNRSTPQKPIPITDEIFSTHNLDALVGAKNGNDQHINLNESADLPRHWFEEA